MAPASTVLISDGGVTVNATAPHLILTSVKASPWILVDPSCTSTDDAHPCNDGAGSGPRVAGDGNWAGPNPRHSEITNVGFADGHVKAMKADRWYYADSAFLKPDVGG